MSLKATKRNLALYFCIIIIGGIVFYPVTIRGVLSDVMNLFSAIMKGNNYGSYLNDFLDEENLSYLGFLLDFIFSGNIIVCLFRLTGAMAILVYLFYFNLYAFQDFNTVCRGSGDNMDSPNYIVYYLLSWITLGIYKMYWFNKHGDRAQQVGRRYNLEIKEKGQFYLWMILGPIIAVWGCGITMVTLIYMEKSAAITFLLLTVISGVIGAILEWIVWILFYNNLNKLTDAYSRGGVQNQMFVAPGPVPQQMPVQPMQQMPQQPTPYTSPQQRPDSATINKRPPMYGNVIEPHTGNAIHAQNYGQTQKRNNAMDDLPTQKGPVKQGTVIALTGEYKGAAILIKDGEEILVGRDSETCHLVFQNPKVSRKHCGIRYSGKENCYYVIDYSKNGMKKKDGAIFPKNQPVRCERSTTILLGTSGVEFRLQ